MSKGQILIYFLAYGGSAAAIFNPFIGLLIYICFAILKPEAIWGDSLGAGNNFSRTIALALLVGWVLRGFGNWKFGKARGIVWALLAFLVWMILSAIKAQNAEIAWVVVEEQFKIVLPFMVGMTVITSIKQLKMLAWDIALSQAYVAYELNVSYYLKGINWVQDYGFGGMDNNCVAIAMVTGAGLAFFLGLTAPRWWQKVIGLAAAGLMAHVVMLSFSRGGMVALILCGFVSFILVPKKPFHYALFFLAVILGLRLAGEQVVDRFMSSFAEEGQRDASAQSRVDMWRDCVDIMARNPVLGVGPHHFPFEAPRYGWPEGKEAHSLWLQVGAELGIPGLTFLVIFYGLCLVRLFRVLFIRDPSLDPWFKDVARMEIASLTAFAISAQFVSLVGLESPYYVVLLGAATLKVLSASRSASPSPEQSLPRGMAPPLPGFIKLGSARSPVLSHHTPVA